MTGDSRFHLVNTPTQKPGTCMLSGSTGPAIDTGFTMQWFPANQPPDRLYLSVDVIREMAEIAGVRNTKSTGEILHEQEIYQRGYMDAVKERTGDQLVELVDRLGLLSALLGGSAPGAPEGDLGGVEGEGPAGPDGDGAPGENPVEPGPGDGPARRRRRADIPGNPAA